jgi:hypothetical protein
MKLIPSLSFSALAVMLMGVSSASAQNVTAISQNSGDTLPGQGGTVDPDYAFFGPFRPGGGNGAQTLTDFTQTQGAGTFNGYDGPKIYAPAGSLDGVNPIGLVTPASVIVGLDFGTTDTIDLMDFTVKAGAASAYDVSVDFGIPYGGGTAVRPDNSVDQSITLVLDDSGGNLLSSRTLNVTDNNVSNSTGLFANFSLTGLGTGDVIRVEATPAVFAGYTDGGYQNVQTAYVLATGFTPVATPEPSTYAMLLAGIGALSLFVRRRLA